MYTLRFDSSNKNWRDDPEENLMFLKKVQRECNHIFKENGYLFLNQVYSKLGVEETEEGNRYGWWYDNYIPFGINFVDFGIYDIKRADSRRFVNGYTPDAILHFNIYGDVSAYLFDLKYSKQQIDEMFNHPWLSANYI